MSELEELKKKKLMELQKQNNDALQNQAQQQQHIQTQIAQMESVVKQFLDKEAIERYGNLKIAHSEKAIQVLAIMVQMIEAGKIRQQISDPQFKEILRRLEPEKRDIKIKHI